MNTETCPQRALTTAEAEVLAAHVGEEAATQESLRVLLERQERCLVAQDLVDLSACLADASPLLDRLEDLTRRRARMFAALGKRLARDPGELRFSDLAALAEPPDRTRLADALAKLRAALQSVARQNARNRALVHTGVEFNQAVVRAVFGGEPAARTYDRAAQTRMAAPVRPWMSREL